MPILTYPVPVAGFWGGLKIASADMRLTGGMQYVATGGGEVIGAALGSRLWEGEAVVAAAHDPGETEAILAALQAPGRSFLATAHKRPLPLLDPAGLVMAAAPVIASLPAGGRSLTLSGLPAGYALSPGDYLSFTRDTPVRHEMHQIVTGATASGAGVTAEFEVVPGIRPGVVVGAAVVLIRAVFRATIIPGSVKFSPYALGPRQGPSFGFRQTLAKATA